VPIIPFIPAIIGAAGSIGGALLSKPGSSTPASTPQTQFNDLLKQTAFDRAGADRKSLIRTLKPVKNYYTTLMSGDRSAVSEALAPQINATNRAYDNANRTAAEFAPRGGGQASGIEALQTKQAGDVGSLFNTARSTGAAGLSSIAPLYGSLSSSELGAASGASATGINAQIQQAWLDFQKSQATTGLAGDLGKTLGSILSMILKKNNSAGGGNPFANSDAAAAGPFGAGADFNF
jgi:hypothetical protein